MKVYVDRLPKCCEECPCCNECMDYGISCNLDDIKLSYYDYALTRHSNCPLQSLADHTKRVRKEVCEEIKKKADVCFEECIYENYVTGKNEVITKTIYSISEVQLDQIQGEE